MAVVSEFLTDKRELVLCGEHKCNDPSKPWFQAKPIIQYLELSDTNMALKNVPNKHKQPLSDFIKQYDNPLGVTNSTWHPEYNDLKMVYITENGLTLEGKEVPLLYYPEQDEVWMLAKPLQQLTQEANISHVMDRVHPEDKCMLKDVFEKHGSSSEGCYIGITTRNPSDYHEGKAWWVNESGCYAIILGSRRPECMAIQRWVTKEVLPSIRRQNHVMLMM